MKASMNSVKFSRYLLAILFLIMFILGIFKVLQTYTTVDLGNLKLCATLRNLNKTFLLYNSDQIIPPCTELCIWGKYPYVYGYYVIDKNDVCYFIFDERTKQLKTISESTIFHKELFDRKLIFHNMYGLWDLKQKCFRNELENLKMSLRKQ